MTTPLDSSAIVRSRISHTLSFPLGYELLRQHFAEALPWTDSRFTFSAHPTTFASEFTQLLRDARPHLVFRLERRAAVQSPFVQPAHWHFNVYPVRRELKSFARAALVEVAFPAAQRFVARAPTHSNYYNRIDAVFDPTERTCCVEQLWEIEAAEGGRS